MDNGASIHCTVHLSLRGKHWKNRFLWVLCSLFDLYLWRLNIQMKDLCCFFELACVHGAWYSMRNANIMTLNVARKVLGLCEIALLVAPKESLSCLDERGVGVGLCCHQRAFLEKRSSIISILQTCWFRSRTGLEDGCQDCNATRHVFGEFNETYFIIFHSFSFCPTIFVIDTFVSITMLLESFKVWRLECQLLVSWYTDHTYLCQSLKREFLHYQVTRILCSWHKFICLVSCATLARIFICCPEDSTDTSFSMPCSFVYCAILLCFCGSWGWLRPCCPHRSWHCKRVAAVAPEVWAMLSVGVRGSWVHWRCSYFHCHGMLNMGVRGNKCAGLLFQLFNSQRVTIKVKVLVSIWASVLMMTSWQQFLSPTPNIPLLWKWF